MKRKGSTFVTLGAAAAVMALALTAQAQISFDGQQTWNNPPSVESWQGGGLTNPGNDGNGYLTDGGYLDIRTDDYPNGSVWGINFPTSYVGDWGALFGTTGTIEWNQKVWAGLDGGNVPYASVGSTKLMLLEPSYAGWHRNFGGQGPAANVVHYSIPFDATWSDAQATANGWSPYIYGANSWASTVANIGAPAGIRYDAAGYNMHLAIDHFVPGPAVVAPPPIGKQTWNNSPSVEGWTGGGLTNPGIDGNGYLFGGYLDIRTDDYPNGSIHGVGLPASYTGDWGAMFGTTSTIEWDQKVWGGLDGSAHAYAATTTSYFNLYEPGYAGWRHSFAGQGSAANVVHYSFAFDANWTDDQALANGWSPGEYGGGSWADTVQNISALTSGFRFEGAGYSMHLAIDNFEPGPEVVPPPPPAPGTWSVGTPIVKYFGGSLPLTDAVAQQAVAGGFNVVGASSMNDLDLAQQYGLRAHWLGGLDDETIVGIRDHPALYSYELYDEPSEAQFASLAATVQHVGALDPAHMVYINLLPPSASYLSQYMSTVEPELVSYDYYNFFYQSGQPYDAPLYFRNLKLVADAARQAGVPFMNVIQGYALYSEYRVPTAGELRFNSYTTLAYGAQGISYFRYPETVQNPDGSPTAVFTALQSINPEFVAIATQVQPLQWIGAYHLGDQPPGTERLPVGSPFTLSPNVADTTYVNGTPVKGMLLGLFGPDLQLADAQYALVVNLDYTNGVTVTVIGPENLSVFDAATGVWSALGSNQATLNLLPGGGTLVGLTSAIPIPEPATLGLLAMGGLALLRRRRARLIST